MVDIESVDMRRLLESKLPQEIYDQIRCLTFACAPALHEIRPDWKPPVQLQLCRDIRREYAKLYFGIDSTFLVDTIFDRGRRHLMSRWLSHLDQQHVRLISGDHLMLVDDKRKYGCGWGANLKVYEGNGMGLFVIVVPRAETFELYQARVQGEGKSKADYVGGLQ